MNLGHCSESWCPVSNGLGPLQQHATSPNFEHYQRLIDLYPVHDVMSHHAPPGHSSNMHSAQYITPFESVGTLGGDWHQLLVDSYDARDTWIPTGVFPQRAYLSYAEKGIQTVHVQSNPTNESGNRQEQPQAHQRPLPRTLVRQESYKPIQRHAEFTGPNLIRFIVDNKEGIRLSDASGGNWEGFEGRDDRSLFGDDRAQVIIRLHFVGCSPWHSKIPTTDFTVKRRPITRARLAAEVAKSVKKFIAREKMNGHDGGHPRCSWGGVSLENVFLTQMIRVSAASWQPEIFVERPSVASSQATSSSSSTSIPIA